MNSSVNTPWPKALRVAAREQWRLDVHMSDGCQLILDLKHLVQRRDAYWRLRQYRYFRMASVDPLGGICWPEGEDLAPDGLQRYQVKSRKR